MTQHKTVKYELLPFSKTDIHGECGISVLCSNDDFNFNVSFQLHADASDFIIPAFSPAESERKDMLWEHTCFEFFIGQHGEPQYREFNLSPSGAWNVYRFRDYREGMKEENLIKTLPFNVESSSEGDLKIDIKIDLNLIQGSKDKDIETGFSAVLENKDMTKSYWALSHPKNTPDFHAREGWIFYSLLSQKN